MPTKTIALYRVVMMLFVGFPFVAPAQRFLSDYDSTLFLRDTVVSTVRRFENLHISGYMQPQFQVAQSKGIRSFEGGNFSANASNRFMIRRARVKLDYFLPSKESTVPAALFTFQFEATERDLNIRDMFVRVFEPQKQRLSLTAGLFARPFGYEVNLSSSYRETPERGRMSQTLMPSERDLGAMVGYEASKPVLKKLKLKLEAGLFNGQGKSGPAEFDSYKDIISRLTIKPFSLSRTISLGGGLSFLNGGWRQDTRYRYETRSVGDKTVFIIDSSLENIGAKALRRYHGADAQLVLKHGWGKTEWRAEYWWGTQPETASTTVNPGEQPEGPTYLRPFDGAFFYFLQNIVNPDWELMVKYDWYDPNRLANADDIGAAGVSLTAADVRYDTWGVGLTRYFSENLKMLAYYSIVTNEKTKLAGYDTDLQDNVFTWRIQMRF